MGSRILVILAAGAGERFGGCKQLTPVGPGGEMLMDYTVHEARRAGFEGVVVVTRPDLDAAMRAHLGRLGGSSLELVHQPAGTHGTVPAVMAARPFLGDDSFGVVNADDLYPSAALEALQAWAGPGHAVVGFRLQDTLLPGSGLPGSGLPGSGVPGSGVPASAAGLPRSGLTGSESVNRALCRLEGADRACGGRLLGMTEASIIEQHGFFVARERDAAEDVAVPADQLVSMNAWAFQASIWGHFEAAASAADGEEVLLPVVMDGVIARGLTTVTVVSVHGCCVGLTWPSDLAAVRAVVGRQVAAGDLPDSVAVRP